MKKILCAIGTRPEAIKMAPLILKLKEHPQFKVSVLTTAQHREMLDEVLKLFGIVPDIDLNIMKANQSLAELTANLPIPIQNALEQLKPDIVLTQGDTTTTFLVGLACFYKKIPVGHVEAGLRSHNLYDPFPEEMDRLLMDRLATLHFAPTEQAKVNLIHEGFNPDTVYVTGNTGIDALHAILKIETPLDPRLDPTKRLILVTAHRRENFGDKLEHICEALIQLAERNQDIQIFYPVHPNPNVQKTVSQYLEGKDRIILSSPLNYAAFAHLMERAYLILTDSGGIQEEAPSLDVPILVLRDTTERPEAVQIGASKMIGTNTDKIVQEAETLLKHPHERDAMIKHASPYGDGKASERIIAILIDKF